MTSDPQHSVMHEYYERGAEADRLSLTGAGQLEFERTKEILLRHLPPPPATVADIGGGPGRYALWLAGVGYRVVHRDIMPLHVEHLRATAAGAGLAEGTGFAEGAGLVESDLGDARDLDLADASADAVLLLGPLYHLVRRADRLQALREARRVVRPGGPVFGAAISRWSARLDGILRQRIDEKYPDAEKLIAQVERTGVLPPLGPGSFCGYTHRPRQLRSEFVSAGFVAPDVVCVEGAAYLIGDLDLRMTEERDRQIVLETARAHERVPELMGLGSHLLATGHG